MTPLLALPDRLNIDVHVVEADALDLFADMSEQRGILVLDVAHEYVKFIFHLFFSKVGHGIPELDLSIDHYWITLSEVAA